MPDSGHAPPTAARAYRIDAEICTGCAGCASVCPEMVIEVDHEKAVVGPGCTSCGACFRFCPVEAISMEQS